MLKRHDFAWRHVPGTTCDGRFICEHLEHWEVRCTFCGERECALTRDEPCVERELQPCSEHEVYGCTRCDIEVEP